MRKKFALGLLVAMAILTLPTLAAAPTSGDLKVDQFFAGVVSTELVMAVKCPIQTIHCGSVNQDCGVEAGQCHCSEPVPGTLKCVKNP